MQKLLRLTGNHLVMSGFYKGISGLSLFISIPFLIKYLGHDDYGIWVLVFTLFQWVLVMDFGIQSSLKTKIPVLLRHNETDFIKSYIKTTYRISGYIAFVIFLLFLGFIYFVDIKDGLNISFHSKTFVYELFIINIFFFCLNSVAGIHKSLYVAFLKGKYTEESLAVNQFGFLILVCLAVFIFPDISMESKLMLISMLNGVFCLAVNLFYTFRFFRMEELDLKTKTKTPKEYINEILRLGYKFMIIQLGMMIFFTVDNYIISSNFGPKDVVPYDTVNKIFQLPVMILFATLAPLWSMFAKDYADQNYTHLLDNFRRFNRYFVGIFFAIIILAALCPFIISIWIKGSLNIPQHLILYIGIVTLMRIFAAFYAYFLNGIGKLNNYIFLIIISVLLKIPLTNLLIRHDFGINSVVISTLFLMLSWIVFIPLESYGIVNKLKKNLKV
jgi:O-antigen/teichoic acid export membrane protein